MTFGFGINMDVGAGLLVDVDVGGIFLVGMEGEERLLVDVYAEDLCLVGGRQESSESCVEKELRTGDWSRSLYTFAAAFFLPLLPFHNAVTTSGKQIRNAECIVGTLNHDEGRVKDRISYLVINYLPNKKKKGQ